MGPTATATTDKNYHNDEKFSSDGDNGLKLNRNFVRIDNPAKIIPILHSRLPLSSHIYNNAKLFQKWAVDSTWAILDGDISENSWIILIMLNNHFGQEISISRPPGSSITPEIREAFSSCPFIRWDESFLIFAMDSDLSAMMSDISVRVKGNCTSVHPCSYYHMDPQEALTLDDNSLSLPPNVELRDMDNAEGRKFLLSTWKYSGGGTGVVDYVDKILARNTSACVYVDGAPVAGVVLACYGHIGMLYTLKEWRGRGYAQICMRFLIKKVAQDGLIPNSVVEIRNQASKDFQLKTGLKCVGHTDFVLYEKAQF